MRTPIAMMVTSLVVLGSLQAQEPERGTFVIHVGDEPFATKRFERLAAPGSGRIPRQRDGSCRASFPGSGCGSDAHRAVHRQPGRPRRRTTQRVVRRKTTPGTCFRAGR
jgi:hypothetical protein